MSSPIIRRRRLHILWPGGRPVTFRFTKSWDQMSAIQDAPPVNYDDFTLAQKTALFNGQSVTDDANDPQVYEVSCTQTDSGLKAIQDANLYEIVVVPSEDYSGSYTTICKAESEIPDALPALDGMSVLA